MKEKSPTNCINFLSFQEIDWILRRWLDNCVVHQVENPIICCTEKISFSIFSELILIIVEGFFILHFFNENYFSRQDYRAFLLCFSRFNKLELFKLFLPLKLSVFSRNFPIFIHEYFPAEFHQGSTTIQMWQNIWAFITSMATKIHVIFFASGIEQWKYFSMFAVQKTTTRLDNFCDRMGLGRKLWIIVWCLRNLFELNFVELFSENFSNVDKYFFT
jgi:hypothetical protein